MPGYGICRFRAFCGNGESPQILCRRDSSTRALLMSGITVGYTVTIMVSACDINGSSVFNGIPTALIALIQRVLQASVTVQGEVIASGGTGLLVLLAVQPGDIEHTGSALLRKITRYRVFSDEDGKMNLSLLDTGGDLLLVPQFTLAADTRKGLRPGFSTAATPDEGARLFGILAAEAMKLPIHVGCGKFGADMKVALINDGPVTFWLQETPD